MYLSVAVNNLRFTLDQILGNLRAKPNYKLLYFNKIAAIYRQIGAGELLMNYDTSAFFKNLKLGVQAYLEFLERAPDGEKATSKAEAFFDAVCVEDREAMARLALLAPRATNPSKEYEEDFLYARVLMDLFGLQKPLTEAKSLLDRYATLHAEQADARYDLVMALINKDKKEFEARLAPLVAQLQEKYADGGDLYRGTLEEAAIMAHVSTEVLAWLRLAEWQGIALDDEIPLAPGSARTACYVPEPTPRAWMGSLN